MFKNALTIISEAAGSDEYNTDDVSFELDDEFENDIEADYTDFDELEDDENIEYTAEMVNIIKTKRGRLVMEFDMLAKYMNSANITDIEEAMQNVCEANGADYDNTYLVLESQEDMMSIVQEAKSKLNKKAKVKIFTKLRDSSNFLKTVKNKGIKVVKKKSNKKKKR